MTFRKNYFILAVLLFVIELLIALYVDDAIIRPYIGDFLVVILIYCFVRAFFKISVTKAAIITLAFAYMVEFLQYMNFIKTTGLQHSRIANMILGNRFEWIDMIAYTLGVITVLIVERINTRLIKQRATQ